MRKNPPDYTSSLASTDWDAGAEKHRHGFHGYSPIPRDNLTDPRPSAKSAALFNLSARDHNRLRKSVSFSPPFKLGASNFAAPARVVVAAALLVGLRNHRRHLQMFSFTVNRHKSQIG